MCEVNKQVSILEEKPFPTWKLENVVKVDIRSHSVSTVGSHFSD